MTTSDTPSTVSADDDVRVRERDGFVYVETPAKLIELDPQEAKGMASALLDRYCEALTNTQGDQRE